MIIQRNVHVEMEILHWLIVLAIASAFVLGLLYGTANGADVDGKPGFLPPKSAANATPMGDSMATHVSPPAAAEPVTHEDNVALWEAMNAIRNEASTDEVRALWSRVRLAEEAEPWRVIVLGIQDLRDQELDRAARTLLAGEQAWPEQPVLHYCLGALRIAQAERALDWQSTPARTQFAAATDEAWVEIPPIDTSVAPNTPAMYEFVAMQSLTYAVRLAPQLDVEARLLDAEWTTPSAGELASSMPMEVARAGDLMEVLGVEDFVARAHGTLGKMYLRRGMTEEAYEHMYKAHENPLGSGEIRRVLFEATDVSRSR